MAVRSGRSMASIGMVKRNLRYPRAMEHLRHNFIYMMVNMHAIANAVTAGISDGSPVTAAAMPAAAPTHHSQDDRAIIINGSRGSIPAVKSRRARSVAWCIAGE